MQHVFDFRGAYNKSIVWKTRFEYRRFVSLSKCLKRRNLVQLFQPSFRCTVCTYTSMPSYHMPCRCGANINFANQLATWRIRITILYTLLYIWSGEKEEKEREGENERVRTHMSVWNASFWKSIENVFIHLIKCKYFECHRCDRWQFIVRIRVSQSVNEIHEPQ